MKTRNRVFLLGSVGKDPEIRSTGSGTIVATFSVATSHRYKDQAGNWTEQTDWHNIKAFARTAEIVRDFVKKGDPVDIEGRISTESWDDKTTGKKQYKTVIVVDSLILLGGKPDRKTVSDTNPAPAVEQVFGEADDSDIPF